MSSLLKFLLAVLVAKIDNDPDPIDDIHDSGESESDEDEDHEENELSEEDLGQEDDPEPKISRRQSAIIKLREEKQEAERKYQQAKDELEAARKPVVNHEYNREVELRKQEDAILSNPDATDWQKYAVQSARDSRQAAATSQNALREARDINDKSDFNQLSTSQPKAFEKYKDKVESMLKDMRSKGRDAPRKELYFYLLGKDMAENKSKISTTKSSESKTGGVKRGSTPGARSDVSTRDSGRLSDSEKRAKRLENVRI